MFSRYIADKFKMSKVPKGYNCGKVFFFFFKIKSGQLLIIPYQLTKFQAPTSYTYRDVLLTRLKYSKFEGAITPEK